MKFVLTINAQDVPFNGMQLNAPLTVNINANSLEHANEKAQRAVEQYRVNAGAQTAPTYVLTEVQ
jgi:predicted ATP-grasp superfamily ATP-dependent carboligase